jgi:hypothetical protein
MTEDECMKQIRMGPSNAVLDEYERPFHVDDWVIEDRGGDREFVGQLIGIGTSRREAHNHNLRNEATTDRGRCTACRWSEIYVFSVSDRDRNVPPGARYCVYTLGPSIVPGENTRANVRWATSGFEVVELCTVRRGERGAPFLPAAHARALAMAANVDDDVADAYVNRAVA